MRYLFCILIALFLVGDSGAGQIFRGSTAGAGSTTLARTGSILELGSNVNTDNASISVPADATFVVVCVSGFYGQGDPYAPSSGAMTLNSVSMTRLVPDGMTTGSGNQSLTYYYLASPSTGTQTLAWDWNGAADPDEGQNITVGFYKGQNTTTPIKDSGGEIGNATTQKSSGEMTAASGDIVVCVGDTYRGGTFTWGNAGTKQADGEWNSRFNYFEWMESSPSGNVTVTMTPTDQYNVLGCLVIGD